MAALRVTWGGGGPVIHDEQGKRWCPGCPLWVTSAGYTTPESVPSEVRALAMAELLKITDDACEFDITGTPVRKRG